MQRLPVALLLAAFATAIAGCGSSSDDRVASDAATPSASADGSTDTTAPASTPGDTAPASTPTEQPAATTPAATSPSGGVSTDGNAAPSPGGAAVDGVPACKSGVLSASLDFSGGGAAGSTTGNLVLRNTSSAACTLSGYPGVSFVGDNGTQLGAAAARSGASAKTITVRAGDSAFAELKITDALNYDAAACGPVDAKGLRVYPPGETAALFVPHTAKACTKNVAILTVGPMSTDG